MSTRQEATPEYAIRALPYALYSLIALFLFPVLCSATTYKWRGNVTELYSDLDEACQADYQNLLNEVANLNQNGCEYSTTLDLCEKDIVGTDPPSSGSDVGKSAVHFTITTPFPACGTVGHVVRPQHTYHAEPVPDSFYVISATQALSQCGSTCNGVAHPINPVSGAVYDTLIDVPSTNGSLAFNRSYNSSDISGADLSRGWRHSASRNIVVKYSTVVMQPYISGAGGSSLYNDPTTACISGFAEVQSQVASWSGAVASYSDGNCRLTKNDVSIGSLTVYSTDSSVAQTSTPVAFDVVRDDGQLIRFTVTNGVITPPPGISLQLVQIASGFAVTDVNNSVEQYDTNGRLLSVTSRSGVVQTMSYDASGRLSQVKDNFGHQLQLNYDAQGHLSSVVRP